ncbi:hypothetical protein VTL71DRAFT_3607 [Oculimacula yallundae]|uniref:Uncharacterized protein n=1 Tax=Oculimacula yallundae TaxID=86028 RepID=A0ABR4C8E6_9HELO
MSRCISQSTTHYDFQYRTDTSKRKNGQFKEDLDISTRRLHKLSRSFHPDHPVLLDSTFSGTSSLAIDDLAPISTPRSCVLTSAHVLWSVVFDPLSCSLRFPSNSFLPSPVSCLLPALASLMRPPSSWPTISSRSLSSFRGLQPPAASSPFRV